MTGVRIAVLVLVCAMAATAQPPRGRMGARTPLDRWRKLSPDQRRKQLDRLPPERRKQVEERSRRLDDLPPGDRERLEDRYRKFRDLPPARQDAIRQAAKDLREMPPERRRALRQEQLRLQELSGEDREKRVASPEYRDRFSERERQILDDLRSLPPPE